MSNRPLSHLFQDDCPGSAIEHRNRPGDSYELLPFIRRDLVYADSQAALPLPPFNNAFDVGGLPPLREKKKVGVFARPPLPDL
jgi:hypothetical protein